MLKESDRHQFLVAAVKPAHVTDGVAVTLVDERGGSVRLHLTSSLAKQLCEHLEMAIASESAE